MSNRRNGNGSGALIQGGAIAVRTIRLFGWKPLLIGLGILLLLILLQGGYEEEHQQLADQAIVPPELMELYEAAASKFNLPWNLLAAVHETDPHYDADRAAVLSVEGKYAKEVSAAAAKYHVDPALLMAIIKQESNFNPAVVSKAGARGLMQLMPENCKDAGFNLKTCMVPANNIMAGAKEISGYLRQYNGNLTMALAAYNAGPGNVQKYHGVPPFKETQDYVRKVPAYYQAYKKQSGKKKGQDKEAVKAKIFKLAETLDRYRKLHEQSARENRWTPCMQTLKRKDNPIVKSGKAGTYNALSCAVFTYEKENWDTVSSIEQKAHSYVGEGMTGVAMVPAKGGFLWPAPTTQRVTSAFSYQRVNPVTGELRPHLGVDLGTAGKLGQPAVAAKAGTVTYAGQMSGYGNVVIIDHGGGITTRYGHLARINVTKGQIVPQGYLIGIIGSTGTSTGPHLHFEIRFNGTAVDPLPYLTGKKKV